MGTAEQDRATMSKVSNWITLGGWAIVLAFGGVIWGGIKEDRQAFMASGKERDKAIQALAIEVTRVVAEMKGLDDRVDRLEDSGG